MLNIKKGLGVSFHFGWLAVFCLLTACSSGDEKSLSKESGVEDVSVDAFGIEENVYRIDHRKILRNQTFSAILSAYQISPATIHTLAEKSKTVFNVRHLQAGKTLRIYQDDSLDVARLVVYQSDPEHYVVFDLRDSVHVYSGQRPVTLVEKQVDGIISDSPYQTLVRQGADPTLALKLSEVFAWQIDFYRIQRGDAFSIVYEERQIDGDPIGLGNIVAARFDHRDRSFNAFRFEEDERGEYYDEEGNSLRKAFLKAPLEYSRISSRYSGRRFHPVLKRYKAHLGTDYAAATGTPIRATGDGVVTNAGYTKGNGNYVKIRHNGTYTTGYLHMSRFAKGIRSGAYVKQGDIIGYVGSTGLATGPHVCYRFWMNGSQVDPLRLDLPSAHPVAEASVDAFQAVKESYLPLLRLNEPVQVAQAPSTVDDSYSGNTEAITP